MADSKLEPIYDRLHGVPQYHPVNAETFADWAMEAGDVVTVSRNGEAHSAPVHSSTLRWRGKQQITINSEGAKEREAIAKMAKKKYGLGGSGVRNSAQMYSYEVNQEHLLYEVYDTQGRVSTLTVNVRGLYHEVYDTDGKFSVLQNTANGLYHEVYDTNGKFSKLQNTVNGLYHEVYDTNGKFSKLQNTANGLYHEVYDTNGKFSALQNTANGLYHEVYDTNGKFSTLQNTVNGLYHEVYDTDGKFSALQNTANGLYHEVYDTDGKFSTLQNTANGLYHEVYDTDGKFSTLQNTANGLYHEVYDTNGKFSTLQNTVNGLYHEVYDTDGKFSALQNTADGLYHEVYDTDGKFATLQNTADGLYHEVYDTDGKFSTLQNTANGLYHEVYDTNGKFSTLQNTANGLYHEVYDTNGKFSTLQNTVNGLYHEVYDTNGKFSTLQNTANGLYHEVYDTNGKFSTLQDTANGLYHEVYDDGTGLKTVVATQAGQLNMVVSGTGSNTKIKPAAIQASIDSATGTSKIYLGADHIELDGDVIADTLVSMDLTVQGLTVTGEANFEESITASSVEADHIAVDGAMLNVSDITIDGNVMTITYVDGTQKTFSKAVASMIGVWSDGTLTVTPNPQGSPAYTSVASVEFWSQNATQDLTLYYVSASTADQGAERPNHRVSKRIDMALDGNIVKLRSYNGSTPSYINGSPFYDISTDISNARTAGYNAALIKLEWSSGTMTASKVTSGASSNPQKLGAGDPSWSGNTATVNVYAYTSNSQLIGDTGFTVSVDASARYQAGYNAAKIKLDWSDGTLTASKVTSGESANPQKLRAGDPTWSGDYATVKIYAYTSNNQLIGDTGATVGVDASARYSAGQLSVTPTDIAWKSSGSYFETHNPNDAEKTVGEAVQLIWRTASSKYYVTLQSRKNGTQNSWNNRISSEYKLGLSGTKVQVQDSSGTKLSNTPEYTIPLMTKNITSNGTYTPDTGYVGFSSVSVTVGHSPSIIDNTVYAVSTEPKSSEGYAPVSGPTLSSDNQWCQFSVNCGSTTNKYKFSINASTYGTNQYNSGKNYAWGRAVSSDNLDFSYATNTNYIWFKYPTSTFNTSEQAYFWLVDNTTDHCVDLWLGNYAGSTYSKWATKAYDYNPYSLSKKLTCTSKTYTGGTWVYTFRYSVSNANLWNPDQTYTFHHNSSFT